MPRMAGWPSRAAILVFSLYLVVGLLIVKDYGVSIDEAMERTSSLSTYVYVMGDAMLASSSETVRSVAETTPEFMAWQDRFYGTALQCATVLVEHIRGFEMPMRDVYLMRHVFVFLNYFAAGVFFYLILRRRFGNTWIPLVGALMYILYPRFFGESFYNIKDILFCAWVVIASYFVMRWLENSKVAFLALSAAALAIATNTRILGLSLLLLACLFSLILGLREHRRGLADTRPGLADAKRGMKPGLAGVLAKPALLLALTFAFYIAVTPFTWERPIGNTVAIFRHFLYYQPWNETHFYLGEMITREVPWHYIPVWMGLTIPLLYIALFAAGAIAILHALARNAAAATGRLPLPAPAPLRVYDAFLFLLFFCTLFGYIGFRIYMYDGWRHAYSLFFPFLYIAAFGLERIFSLAANGTSRQAPAANGTSRQAPAANGTSRQAPAANGTDPKVAAPKTPIANGASPKSPSAKTPAANGATPKAASPKNPAAFRRRAASAIVAALLCFQLIWIAVNHPYQYVYFNIIGKQVAEQNFMLDYWCVSHLDLIRYALAYDDRPFITIDGGNWGWKNELLMTEEEKGRVFWANDAIADYSIQDTRIAYEDRVPVDRFVELYAASADGMDISKLYKRIAPMPACDAGAWNKIIRFESNLGSDYSALRDGDCRTAWGSDRPQQPGDYIIFEFSAPVDYDYISLLSGKYPESFPRALDISVSADGAAWTAMPYTDLYRFDEKPAPYRFIKLENKGADDACPWLVYEMGFGHSYDTCPWLICERF